MKRPRTVVVIGNMDGVHIGHAALVRRARQIADSAHDTTRVVALVFDPHPQTVLRPHAAPARLTTFARRAEILGTLGVDEVVRLEPTGNLLAESPDQFIERLVGDLAPLAVVEGPDFRFGRGREGDVQTLARLGARYGFAVEVVEPVEAVLTDLTAAAASSSLARWLIGEGRVRDAALVLGRPHGITGTVVRGDRRGRTIGFPTANLESECLSPADGVYSGIARLQDGRELLAAISVGTKPTFGGTSSIVEAHLLDARSSSEAIEGLPEYNWPMLLEFHHWVRDQAKFGSIEALVDQMGRDCQRVRTLQGEPACR